MTARTYTRDDICLGSIPAMQGTEDWRRVGALISDVSETLYCAGWMQHAEYDVYRLMTEGGRWGAGDTSWVAEELGVLHSLSRRLSVWVIWCDDHGREPMRLHDWQKIYASWRRDVHATHLERGYPDPHVYDDGDDARPGDLCVWCLAPKPVLA